MHAHHIAMWPDLAKGASFACNVETQISSTFESYINTFNSMCVCVCVRTRACACVIANNWIWIKAKKHKCYFLKDSRIENYLYRSVSTLWPWTGFVTITIRRSLRLHNYDPASHLRFQNPYDFQSLDRFIRSWQVMAMLLWNCLPTDLLLRGERDG